MKKFISMVMAAAMVASLAPATAFAANGTRKGEVTATAKVVDADILTKDEAAKPLVNDPYPEVQLKITGVDYSKSDDSTYTTFKQTVEVALDKAHWTERPVMGIRLDDTAGTDGGNFYEDAGTYGQYIVKAATAGGTTGDATLADVQREEARLANAAKAWWQPTTPNSQTFSNLQLKANGSGDFGAEVIEDVLELPSSDPFDIVASSPTVTQPANVLKDKKVAEAAAKQAYEDAVAAAAGNAAYDAAVLALTAAETNLEAEQKKIRDAEADARNAASTLTAKTSTFDTAKATFDAADATHKAAMAEKTTLEAWKAEILAADGTATVFDKDDLADKAPLAYPTVPGSDVAFATALGQADTTIAAKLADKNTAQTALTNATNDLKTAETAVETADKALAAVKAEVEPKLPALKKAVADAQEAVDKAAGNAAKDEYDAWQAAIKATEAAQAKYDAAKANYQSAYERWKAVKASYDGESLAPEAGEGETLLTIECVEWNQTSKRDDAKSWAKFEILGKLHKDDVLFVDMKALLNRTGEGTKATVSVDSDMCVADDLVFATVSGQALQLSTRKLASVAEDEAVLLDDSGLKVVSAVGGFGDEIELKLSKGFEFVASQLYYDREHDKPIGVKEIDGNKMVIAVPAEFQAAAADGQNAIGDAYVEPKDKNEFTIYGIKIEATSAKSGATATITAKSKGFDSAACEVAKVVDYKVDLTVDEDEDVPVIYSGVNVDNYGITDDSDHWSVEVTAEETFPGAWSFRKGFNFELPEGVHVTDVDIVETDALLKSYDTAKGTATAVTDDDVMGAFFDAYQDGSHMNFEFDKRVFDDVDATLSKDTAMMTFKLQLVADPTFEGDVVLKLSGELVDDQEVTIAKFVKPYTVKAEQNDIIIDYRYTDIPTAITITEAEKGLWAKNEATFKFYMERGDKNFMDFEDDPTFEIDSKSGMEIKDEGVNGPDDNQIWFTVKTESDEAATINIKDIKLFMNRSIPAGPYDLSIGSTLEEKFLDQQLFAPDCVKHTVSTDTAPGGSDVISTHKYAHAGDPADVNTPQDIAHNCAWKAEDNDCVVDSIDDYSSTVKEAFINVVTAGRDVDDASFTTKVVVPVGENYIVAGEKQIELDTPAYINEAGYTMLPIRAVATALGINNSNVLWDQPTKTVTILYGQRIITMSQGQKVVYVNGSAIPASAAVENTNSRTFLPMRDLATALGVTDITWDQATRTATLNGNQK